MAGREPDYGPTARTVAENVTRLRLERGFSYTQLSVRLVEAGSTLTAVGVRRIEERARRVTVDDLLNLAVALDVSPITLLMPPAITSAGPVEASGLSNPVTAERLWEWLGANSPLPANTSMSESDRWVEFMHVAYPAWKVRQIYEAARSEMAESQKQRNKVDQLRTDADPKATVESRELWTQTPGQSRIESRPSPPVDTMPLVPRYSSPTDATQRGDWIAAVQNRLEGETREKRKSL